MSADDGRQDRDAEATSGIRRREVLLTVGRRGGRGRPARWPSVDWKNHDLRNLSLLVFRSSVAAF
jgi:hypothetical protein